MIDRPDKQVPTAPSRHQPRGVAALLTIDMFIGLEFRGSDRSKPKALRAAKAICALRERFDAAEIPVICVKDTFGEWHSERSKLIKQGPMEAETRSQAELPLSDCLASLDRKHGKPRH